MWYIIILIAVTVYIFASFRKGKDETVKEVGAKEEPAQPMHFDLLDENGDPLPEEPVVEELNHFCIKDKGYHVSECPKDMGIGEYVEITIAGLYHCDHIADYLGEHVGTLEAEPTNPYDANAIQILAEDGHPVGYVPKDMTEEIRRESQLPCPCYFYIGNNNGTYYSDAYITL